MGKLWFRCSHNQAWQERRGNARGRRLCETLSSNPDCSVWRLPRAVGKVLLGVPYYGEPISTQMYFVKRTGSSPLRSNESSAVIAPRPLPRI